MENNLARLFSECRARIGEGGSSLLFLGFEATEEAPGCYVLMNVETEAWLSPVMFEAHGSFSDGVAPVKVNGLWGYIKENGEFLIEPMYRWAKDSLKGVLHVGDKDGLEFLLEAKTGDFVCGDTGFDSVELFGNRDDAYIVRQGHSYGILAYDGVWLADTRHDCIQVISDELVWLKEEGMVKELISGKNVAKATVLDLRLLNEFGVFSCYNGDLDQTEFFKLTDNKVESLFVAAGRQESLTMKNPNIIFGSLGKWDGSACSLSSGMFLVKEKKWLFEGLTDIEYLVEDGFEYYEIERGRVVGIVDVDGNLLVDIVVKDYKWCKGNFILDMYGGWGVYNVAERRLSLPLAEDAKFSSTDNFKAYRFMRTEKGKWRSKKLYRYWVNGKFISDFEFIKGGWFVQWGDFYVAPVQRLDRTHGWIDENGEFWETLPGEFTVK